MNIKFKAITLMELLISIIIVSIIILALGSIDLFSRHHVIGSERRAKLQNEVTHALEHINKNITGTSTRGGAIGDRSNNPPIDTTTGIAGDRAIIVRIDSDNDGMAKTTDARIAYRYRPAPDYEIWYYPNYVDASSQHEIIISDYVMRDFHTEPPGPNPGTFNQNLSEIRYSTANNYLEMQLIGCWDPLTADLINPTPENPCVTMQATIKLPAVSTN